MIMKNLFSFDKRFGLLYEDIEVTKDTFARYVYHPKQPSWGIDCVASQAPAPSLPSKSTKFICNHLCYLPALQNLNVM